MNKENILQQEPTFLPKAKKDGYVCPICGSGSGKNGTGITSYTSPKGKTYYKCFACELHQDIIGLWQIYNKRMDYDIALEELSNYYSSTNNSTTNNLDSYFTKCASNLDENDNYFKSRGLSKEIIKKYNLGLDTSFKGFAAAIIPTSFDSYVARNIDALSLDRYKNIGNSHLYLTENLIDDKDVFVVEGEIDALSLIECGYLALALGSISNKNKFIDFIKTNNIKSRLLLALDNDEPGKRAAKEIEKQLSNAIIVDIYNEYKDANEILLKDKQKLIKNLKKSSYYKLYSNHNFLTDFKNNLGEKKFIKTHIKTLDNILDGGLCTGVYYLGAVSSLGKTTFALQIADNIAANGTDVLIFSLEMARYELMAKSISRLTFLKDKEINNTHVHAKTTRGLLFNEIIGDDDKLILNEALKEYENISKRIFTFEGVGDISALDIRAVVERHITFTKNKPVIFIDYLQILAPSNDKLTSDKQIIDKSVNTLKQLSRDLDIPVLVISSFNRESYTEPVTMSSFKESGNIEYGADALIGLQYFTMDYEEGESKDKRLKRLRALKNKIDSDSKNGEPIKVQIKNLKTRDSFRGDNVVQFIPKFNIFEEIDKI